MASQPKHLLTPKEYLVRERLAETKSEYHQGEVFARAAASREHNLVVASLFASFVTSLRQRNCEVYRRIPSLQE